MGSHLVSIHSDTENHFLLNLVYSNTANQRAAVPTDHGPCWYQWAWIGYSGIGDIGTGDWTDGSPVDYLQTAPQDRVFYFQISNDTSCG
ncbi:unnamed protein product, partial [Mesorhabditis belari]|uniref:C-type lectin domain-containing protein n=1 Tax=Mesorhabditis belari TaxID=2138241 RepID=A0AAF3ELR9_9BILA